MNEGIQITAVVLTPFLVGGALVYFTRRNRNRQFYVLLPMLLVANVWLGFANGWRTLDFVQLGFFLLWGVVACFLMHSERRHRSGSDKKAA